MKRLFHQLTTGPALIVLGLCLAIAPGLQAADVDLSSELVGPSTAAPGESPLITVNYGNAGPDVPGSAVIDIYVPTGLPMPMSEYTQEAYDALQESAATFDEEGELLTTTDTLGNTPVLYIDDNYCEHMKIQLKGPPPDYDYVEGLEPGVSGSFTFNPQFPLEDLRVGSVEVLEPANLALTLLPAVTSEQITDAATYNRYGRGGCQEDAPPSCSDLAYCFGQRVSELEPIIAELELVNDGSEFPTLGCGAFENFTPGKIALLERGECFFDEKVFNAELAGAAAVFMVNTTGCGGDVLNPNPDSERCVINMGESELEGLATIPVIQVSRLTGTPILEAVTAGTPVTVRMGPQGSEASLVSSAWLHQTPDHEQDGTNDDDTLTIEFVAAPDPPVAAFSFAPSDPTTGQDVMFTDMSTGSPTMWAWDFGDGATSTDQNPTHAFTSAGTFPVSLMVTNAGGTDTATQDVIVTLSQTMTEAYFIPAAALAAGAVGSFFQTDIDINNSGSTEAAFKFLWLPRATDNSTPAESASYSLAAGAGIRFENVLQEVFGAEPDVAGSLAVMSNSGDLLIGSRTYNLPTAKASGTFGQALPGIPADGLIMQGETKRIIFMSENDDLRANLGCVNGVNDSVRVIVDIYDDAGNLLETKNMDLAPWSNNQFNRIFQAYAPTDGYATVRANKAGAAFYCYGSVLDNGSNDPTSILPVEYGAAAPFVTYFVPAAALAAGLEGSFFQTDVDINNAGSATATYQFMWLPRGEDNSSPTVSESFTLAAGASVRYENVLSEVFEASPDVSGALAISADSADLGIMSRTYNLPTAKASGTFGQAIPGIPASNLIMQGETQRIIFMSENDDLRANLGCVNGVDDSVRIIVDMYDDAGNLLETKNMDLAPWSNNQFNRLFRNYAPTNGYADVKATKAGAAYYCYGSVLDNGSNDPTTILPQ